MSGIDTPRRWSAEQIRTNTWLKWRLAGSPAVRAIADAALSGTVREPVEPPSDPLVTALIALAADPPDPDRALCVLGESQPTAIGDARTALGDLPGALAAYQRAVALDDTDPVAVIGAAVAAIRDHRAAKAVHDLRSLRTVDPDNPVLAHYLALALVCRATEARALSRDEDSVITSPAQLNECERICLELTDIPVADPDLDRAVDALTDQVLHGGTWAWRQYGGNGGLVAALLVLSLACVMVGGAVGDLWLVIGAALVGAGSVFLYVVTHRRPAWELRAQDLANMITNPGHAD